MIVKMKKLPLFLKQYFWEVNFDKLNPNKYPYYIIGRILEYGDEKAVKWMFENFETKKMKRAIVKRRDISPLSANYWRLVLDIPKNKILCLKKQFPSKLQKTWSY